jgi:hypothetical protein
MNIKEVIEDLKTLGVAIESHPKLYTFQSKFLKWDEFRNFIITKKIKVVDSYNEFESDERYEFSGQDIAEIFSKIHPSNLNDVKEYLEMYKDEASKINFDFCGFVYFVIFNNGIHYTFPIKGFPISIQTVSETSAKIISKYRHRQ